MKRVLSIVLVIIVLVAMVTSIKIDAVGQSVQRPAWANPTAMTVKRISNMGSAQTEPNFLNNLDCTLNTYRLVASSNMQTGCFTETAFGMIDSDSDTVIFNGTDEGLPLLPYSNNQVLAPWPRAMDLIAMDAINTGGSYISLYKNPLGSLQDQRNILAQLTSKRLTAPPELTLRDPSGNRLVINPQTLAFSDGGSWMVAETVNGSFIRINLATLDVLPFAQSYGSQGNPATLKSRVAISQSGQYIAIFNDAASEFKTYDLTACNGTPNNLVPLNCPSHDYRSFINSRVTGLKSIRHIRFVNEGLLSFEAVSITASLDGIYELAPSASIDFLTDYIGLGDSYTSGEGAFDYLAGTDTAQNLCHLSSKSYPLLLTRDLFTARGGHSVACSGAVIEDIVSTSDGYKGQASGVASWGELQKSQTTFLDSIMTNYLPGYIAQHHFVGTYQPRILTVSIGGNDVGFGDMLQNCVTPHVSRHQSDSTCYNTYEDRQEITKLIDRTVPRWVALFKQLRRSDPNSTIYTIGYPQVIYDKGSCAINVQLGKSELEFAAGLIDYLNKSILKASETANVSYVDIGQALYGHRLCETKSHSVAVNGLTAGKDSGILGLNIFGRESYHPNALGHQLIEQAILKQTNNLVGNTLGESQQTSSQPLLIGAKTGRKLNTVIPARSITKAVTKKGRSTTISVKGVKTGTKANSIYEIRIDGSSGMIIGSITSDNLGNLEGSVIIPESTSSGGHTLDVIGPGQTDEPLDITQPIYVQASESDSDGDGIPDILDTCPGAINSGEDTDEDGVDDICDNLIGLPTSTITPLTSLPNSSNRGKLSSLTRSASNKFVKSASTTNRSNAKHEPLINKSTWQSLRIISWLPYCLLLILFVLIWLGLNTYLKWRR